MNLRLIEHMNRLDERMPWLMESFFHLRLGRSLGLLFFVVGISFYHSYAHRPVLGIWSYPFLMVYAISVGILLGAIVSSWKKWRGPSRSGTLRQACVDLAILFWGIAYLISAVDEPVMAGRIAELIVFGATSPTGSLFEWIALGCLVVAFALVPTPGNKWANARLAIATVLILFVLGEGVARVKASVAPVIEGYPTYSTHLWERRYVHINQEGFRDQDHSVVNHSAARRLLVVGDSFAFGYGINRVEDRFGEQLGKRLDENTQYCWEPINGSRPDTHTLHHIDFLRRLLTYHPDVVILLYVFNDIDYLYSVTPRAGPSEAPQTLLAHYQPLRLAFENSYLFQEAFIRLRLINYSLQHHYYAAADDPYTNSSMVSVHLNDLARFVASATETTPVVGVVPFDIDGVFNPELRHTHEKFVDRAIASGIPMWPINAAFKGYDLNQLIVNKLDRHPNELANRLAAAFVLKQVLTELKIHKDGAMVGICASWRRVLNNVARQSFRYRYAGIA
jgi:hypothetical protein